MKNFCYILISVCVLSLIVLGLASCGSKLDTPSGLYLDVETQTLSWNMVKGANYYIVQISGQDDVMTKATYISLENLEAGEYEIKIQANSDGEARGNSSFAKYQFTREAETGLKYQLINNDTEYELIGAGSASGAVVMEDYFRGKPVTSIAEKALYHNSKITSFTVGNNVKSIGAKAFTKCSKMTEIVIPNNVVTIGEYAFQSCKALTKITLPDSVTTIAPYTFAWCSELQEVTLGKGVTLIDEYAFSNCDLLTTMTYTGLPAVAGKAVFPDSLENVATYAFADCYALADLSVGNGLKNIAPYAFCNNKGLTKLDLGTSLTTIADCAFFGCTALPSVAIPDSTEYLGQYVFYGCTSLSEASFGAGLRAIGNQIFVGTPLLANATNELVVDGWLLHVLTPEIENYTVSKDVHGIASYAFSACSKLVQANLSGVKYVGMAAFYGCEALYKVTFDNSLEEIGDYAFYGCTYLKDVAVGNNLKSIGNYAFTECRTLVTIAIPDTVTSIGTQAFRNAAAFNTAKPGTVVYIGNWAVDFVPSAGPVAASVRFEEGTRGIANHAFSNQTILLAVMPDSVIYVGRGAFYKSTAQKITLSKSLKYIGDYAFYGCGNANFGEDKFDLVIPEGTEYIGRSAFYKCTYILGLNIPGSVKEIGPYAFYGCANIGATVEAHRGTGELDENGNEIIETQTLTGYITLGEGIVTIGDRAFQNCIYLVDVTIPNSVTYLGVRSFYKCISLKSLTLGSGLTRVEDYAFYKCAALETVKGGEKLESIGNYAFRGCELLKEIPFKSVKTIGRYSFYGCASLSNITLPGTVTSIGDYAFRGCAAATAIILPDSVETMGKHVFYGLNDTTIYTNADSIKPYWDSKFNSSFRPVFWGCTLSEDDSYVVSFTAGKNLLINGNAKNGSSDPIRSGYTFIGWATEAGSKTVAYTSENVAEAPEGTVLYAVWDVQADNNQ